MSPTSTFGSAIRKKKTYYQLYDQAALAVKRVKPAPAHRRAVDRTSRLGGSLPSLIAKNKNVPRRFRFPSPRVRQRQKPKTFSARTSKSRAT